MNDTDYLGSEVMEAEGPFEPRKYKITAECTRCGHQFSWVAKSPGGKDRPCPLKACREAAVEEDIQRRAENMAQIIAEQRAPATIGDNVQNRAIDTTAAIVMSDYGMTDLRDNVREGESVAPKLAPNLQRQADGFFGGGGVQSEFGKRRARQMDILAKRALAGQFRATALNPTQVIGGQSGENPLRKVGEERLK